jgi:phospholipid transport system substrate-binding protein
MKNRTASSLFLSLALSLTVGLVTPVQTFAQYNTPTETVQSMLDTVFGMLRSPDFDLTRDKESIGEAVSIAFDTNTIAQSALAANYRELNAEQRAEFEVLFFDILKNTYIDRLDGYTDETVEITGEELDGNRGTVKSLVYTTNSNISVDYSLRQRPNGWFIYDIIVEDVSLLSSYRSTYRSIIRRSGIDGLLNDLRNQASELE